MEFTLVWVRVFVAHFQEHPDPIHTWDIRCSVTILLSFWGMNLLLLGLLWWKCSPRCPLFWKGPGGETQGDPAPLASAHIWAGSAVWQLSHGDVRLCQAWVSASPAILWAPCSLPIIGQSWFLSLASKEPGKS